ncbi:F-BAR domain only protein 2, partial [Varanus komodoensis]
MYGCESWTIRKAERRRIEAFELWCWRKLLRVPWTAVSSNRSVLEEINPDCSLEGQILKMKLKYFGHLMRKKDSLEKTLMLGTVDGKRRERQRMSLVKSMLTKGERNNGFDVLYHNMKHGHVSTKELADFIRERAAVEEAYSRSMTKLAKSANSYSQNGTFAPVWDVFKSSTEKLAGCHLELVRKLQELIKEVQKYGDEQMKAHKKTKEEVSGTLEAVQNIQSITQALQKAKENYNSKCVEQERLKKESATQREIDKAALKSKKATDTYKHYVEKYAAAKCDFEQKMTETAQ